MYASKVEHLKYATPVIASRCEMIWFGEDIIDPSMIYWNYLQTLSSVPLDVDDDDALETTGRRPDIMVSDASTPANLTTQKQAAAVLECYYAEGELVSSALTFAESIKHIIIPQSRVPRTPCSLSLTRPSETLPSTISSTQTFPSHHHLLGVSLTSVSAESIITLYKTLLAQVL
jgi:hypothetical protein